MRDRLNLAFEGDRSVRKTTVAEGNKHEFVHQSLKDVPKISYNRISVNACRKNGMRVAFVTARDGRGVCSAEEFETSKKLFPRSKIGTTVRQRPFFSPRL